MLRELMVFRRKRFVIVQNPVRMHQQSDIKDVLFACVILHNMIVGAEKLDPLPCDWE